MANECAKLGDKFSRANACPDGWAAYDTPVCTETNTVGTCDDLIANPFVSVQCCCEEMLD